MSLPTSSWRTLCSPDSVVNFQESVWSAQVCTCWSSTWTQQGNSSTKLNYENFQWLVPITVSFPWKRVEPRLLHQHQARFALESASFTHSKYFVPPLPSYLLLSRQVTLLLLCIFAAPLVALQRIQEPNTTSSRRDQLLFILHAQAGCSISIYWHHSVIQMTNEHFTSSFAFSLT